MDSGVRATVVTAGHCTHTELISGHAFTAVACTPAVYAKLLSNYSLIRKCVKNLRW